jgi:antitoxin component of RelBE/YafQ-DinJ toxin-antitoxin module
VYSPKINEDLIRNLYRIAKAKGIPMTELVNGFIADAIRDTRVEVKVVSEPKEVLVITGDEPSPEQIQR